MPKKTNNIVGFVSVIISCSVTQLSAQSTETFSQKNEEIDEVVVTGLRGSLQRSLDAKRESGNIIDAISAEDIGKFPDQNVAESLQRISGVQISRNKGEGENVSIRGLDPDLVLVTINGRRAPSSTANDATFSVAKRGRRFQFDQLSSDLVSSLEVHKTTQARLDEGGIAGTINIKTPRPFDIGDQRISLRAGGAYNELNKDFGPELGALYSNIFENDIGLMLAISYSDREIRQDFADQPGYRIVDVDADLNVLPNTQTDIPSGSLLYDDVFLPQSSRIFMMTERRERLGASGTLQFRASDALTITTDLFFTRFKLNERSDYLETLGRSVQQFTSVEVNNNNTIVSYTGAGQFRTVQLTRQPTVKTRMIGVGFDYDNGGAWRYNGDISTSKNDSEESKELLFYRHDGSIGVSFSEGAPFSMNPGFDVSDATAYNAQEFYREHPLRGTDEEVSAKFDALRLFDANAFKALRFGIKYSSAEKIVDEDENGPINIGVDTPLATISTMVNGVLGSATADLPSRYVVPDIDAWRVASSLYSGITHNELPLADFEIGEDVLAVYLQADFEGAWGSADAGVRVVRSDQQSSGWAVEGATTTPISQDRTYTDVLPSANLALKLQDNLLLRFALGKVMSRPDMVQISPSININLSQLQASAGEPALDPYRATQFDSALEWYMSDTSLLSFGYFIKDIDSFIDFVTRDEVIQGNTLSVTRPINGEGVKLQGFEFSYQQTYDFLPAPFDGLGLLFNYTRISSDAELVNELTGQTFGMSGSSKNSYNIAAIYEKDRFGARLAYNYRDQYVERVSGNLGNPEFVDSYGQFDLSMNFDINDTVSLAFDAINLTDEVIQKYSFIPERPFEYAETGRRYMLGIRVSL